uniref:Uncharacterized protein n=1 Tax=Anopheles coluzzii TaxID=1518534 RepID=A0A8W7Q3N1_ANOCL
MSSSTKHSQSETSATVANCPLGGKDPFRRHHGNSSGTTDPLVLPVQQKHVPMEASFAGRRSANVIRQRVPLRQVHAGYVHHQPVVPFAKLGRRPARRVRIGQHERVVGVRFRLRPGHLRHVLHLGRGEDVAKVDAQPAGIGHVQEALGRDRHHVRHYLVVAHIAHKVRHPAGGERSRRTGTGEQHPTSGRSTGYQHRKLLEGLGTRHTPNLPAAEHGFVKHNPGRLLVDEEHVPVQPGTLRRSGTDVIGQHVARIDVRAGDVTHQPVFPAAHLRIAARRCIRIGHQQRVEGARLNLPAQLRAGLYLGRRELIAERHFHVRLGVGDLDRLLRCDVDQIRHDFVAPKRFGCWVRRLTANGHQR